MLRIGLLAIFLGGAFSGPAAAAEDEAAPALLFPHRAVYDVNLRQASSRSGVEGLRGRMVYEFSGSVCRGFTTRFRLVTRIVAGEETRTSDQQTNTFEDIAAGLFRFETSTFTDERPESHVAGEARRVADGLAVEISAPEARSVTLADSRFPAAHMLDLLANARDGKRFFKARLYDGTDNGDKANLTTVVIGARQPAKVPAGNEASSPAGVLAGQGFWPVTVAYFNEEASGDPAPVYNTSFKLYENGISDDLIMDYGDFSLSGTLSSLELLPAPAGEDEGEDGACAPKPQ